MIVEGGGEEASTRLHYLHCNTIHLYLAVEVDVSIISRLCTLQVTFASHFHPGVGQNRSEREREREKRGKWLMFGRMSY